MRELSASIQVRPLLTSRCCQTCGRIALATASITMLSAFKSHTERVKISGSTEYELSNKLLKPIAGLNERIHEIGFGALQSSISGVTVMPASTAKVLPSALRSTWLTEEISIPVHKEKNNVVSSIRTRRQIGRASCR